MAHVTSSVGWLGAVLAYLALAIDGRTSTDPQLVRAAYLSMERVAWLVIVPCSLGSLVTGLAHSLFAEWGLLKHYWVLTKLVLVLVGTAILLVHLRTAVDPMARAVATSGDAALSSHAFGALPTQLIVHPAGGLLVLLVATALSVWKPWGRTGYGKPERRAARGATE